MQETTTSTSDEIICLNTYYLEQSCDNVPRITKCLSRTKANAKFKAECFDQLNRGAGRENNDDENEPNHGHS